MKLPDILHSRFCKPVLVWIGYICLWIAIPAGNARIWQWVRQMTGISLVRGVAVSIFAYAAALIVSAFAALLPAPQNRSRAAAALADMYLEILAAVCAAVFSLAYFGAMSAFWSASMGLRFFLMLLLSFAVYASFVVLAGAIYARIRARTVRGGLLAPRIAQSYRGQWHAYGVAVLLFLAGLISFRFHWPTEAGTVFLLSGLAILFSYCARIAAVEDVRRASEAIARGEWDVAQEPSRPFALREIEDNLRGVAHTMRASVAEQIKSERTKAELIANVSHDIKTPLTSIINYVDLLKKEPVQSEAAESYLRVLERKSQRLKALIVDLLEAARAGSGDVAVELAPLDFAELIAQVAGDFDDRMMDAGLSVAIDAQEPISVMADGRHAWRALENLFMNIVLYAQPGTRVYGSLDIQDGHARLTLKNISAQPLNIPAEELLARFVRGDRARHTEGSGLGLFIAQNLLELQGGGLAIRIDGDLFEAAVSLPLCPSHPS